MQDDNILSASTADEMKRALSKPGNIPIWNQGIGQKIRKCKVQYEDTKGQSISFDGTNIQGVVATSSNPASQKILEKAGFRLERKCIAHETPKSYYKKDFEKTK